MILIVMNEKLGCFLKFLIILLKKLYVVRDLLYRLQCFEKNVLVKKDAISFVEKVDFYKGKINIK